MAMEKLYLSDSYLKELTTTIIERGQDETGPFVTLAETIIYPGGGGQPADIAWIDGQQVLQIAETDGQIRYYLENVAAFSTTVTITIDWARRYDLMQQHTGQHILPRALEDLLDAEIKNEQMTETSNVFLIAKQKLTEADLLPAFQLANQIIREHRPISALLPNEEQFDYPYLKHRPNYFDGLRLIDIQGFDTIGCGGTHVANTSEVQLIVLEKIQVNKKGTTLFIACGQRAIQLFNRQRSLIDQLQEQTQRPFDETTDYLRNQKEQLAQLKKQLTNYRVQEMLAQVTVNEDLVMSLGQEVGVQELKEVGAQLAEQYPEHLICTYTIDGAALRYHLHLQTARETFSVRNFIQEANRTFGGKGGGSPVMGDASVPAEKVQELFDRLQTTLNR